MDAPRPLEVFSTPNGEDIINTFWDFEQFANNQDYEPNKEKKDKSLEDLMMELENLNIIGDVVQKDVQESSSTVNKLSNDDNLLEYKNALLEIILQKYYGWTLHESYEFDNIYEEADDEANLCKICFSTLELEPVFELPCFHKFHIDCIIPCFAYPYGKKCINCNKEFVLKPEYQTQNNDSLEDSPLFGNIDNFINVNFNNTSDSDADVDDGWSDDIINSDTHFFKQITGNKHPAHFYESYE